MDANAFNLVSERILLHSPFKSHVNKKEVDLFIIPRESTSDLMTFFSVFYWCIVIFLNSRKTMSNLQAVYYRKMLKLRPWQVRSDVTHGSFQFLSTKYSIALDDCNKPVVREILLKQCNTLYTKIYGGKRGGSIQGQGR